MIYREFLAGILAPLIVVSALLFAWRHRTTRAHWTGRFVLMGLLAVVAVCYTAPWDGWIIRNSVWTYPVGSIWGTIADVPIEEYLFMIGQTVFVGFWALTVLPATPMQAPTASQSWRRPVYCAAWLVAALIGGVAAALDTNALYLGSMLVWFGPPLALQAAVGADLLRAARRPRLTALSITVVLWFADLFAISSGAW